MELTIQSKTTVTIEAANIDHKELVYLTVDINDKEAERIFYDLWNFLESEKLKELIEKEEGCTFNDDRI